jgi:uncharacterized protein
MSLKKLTESTHLFLQNSAVDKGHGFAHAKAVRLHVWSAASSATPPISDSLSTSLQAAALLHDVDDHKFFSTSDYKNARALLKESGFSSEAEAEIVKIISLVSASSNGSSVDLTLPKEYYWVRAADILESIGEIGIARCYEYNLAVGRPLFRSDTPKPKSLSELDRILDPARFQAYVEKKGDVGESSMIDHYFDKLLHLECPAKNSYLQDEFEKRMAAMRQFVVEFGQAESVDVSKLESLKKNYL